MCDAKQFPSKVDIFNSRKTKSRRKGKKKNYNEQVELCSVKPQQKNRRTQVRDR